MFSPSVRFVVLGGPVPEALRNELDPFIQLLPDGTIPDEKADGALAYARAEVLEDVSRLRRQGGRFPLYALADGPVDVATRIAWIRHGVDDLLDPASAAATLRRRLDAELNKRVDPRDEAFRRAFVQRWITAMHRYVVARRDVLDRMGDGGLARYLDCARLRDFCARASDPRGPHADSFGERRAAEREALHWPIRIVEPEACDGSLLNVGADGVALSCDRPPADLLRADIRTGELEATLALEVRWQRRVGRELWEAGALVTGVTIHREA